MIDKDLKEKVLAEAIKLKVHATQEECARLDFGEFYARNPFTCIYGQMTGICYSQRATELLNLCTVPYSEDIDSFKSQVTGNFIVGEGRHFSPIEFYICQEEAKNKTLIDFLKGERESLRVDDL